MKMNKMLKLLGLLGAFTLAVGCAGPAEQQPEAKTPAPEATKADDTAAATNDAPESVASGGAMSSYEVVKGDNLWAISSKGEIYGNPYKWPLIYKANSDKIKDADLIKPGQVLDINTDPSDEESAAAIHHAKTRGSWSLGVTEESDKAYLAQ